MESPRIPSGFSSSPSLSQTIGVTRSRTLLFLSYRESSPNYRHRNDGGEEERLIGSADDDLELDELEQGLPPVWVDVADQAEALIESARGKITYLDKLYAKHVLPGFTDRSAEEREIDTLTREITSEFRRAHSMLQKIGDLARSHSRPTSSSQPNKPDQMAVNLQTGLANKLQELSSGFRKKQGVYLRQLKGHETRTSDLLTSTSSIPLQSSAKELEDDVELSRTSLAQSSLLTDDVDMRLINERDREITLISKSIAELADIFKDLSNMVIDQGSLLDRIDYNVEQLATNVESAVQELKQATKHQKKSGKRSLIFLLCLLIFGAILVLIYKPRGDSIHPGQPSMPDRQRPPPVDEDTPAEDVLDNVSRFLRIRGLGTV
ncbi:t-SNARE [Atractiella rhizophila]|nr:t-SNARE [Atractiella rhizophila]